MRRRILTGLTAAALAAGMSFIAGPAGAVLANACTEGMNPAMQSQASSLHVDCTFTSTGISSSITINDYPTAAWHSGAARSVNVNDGTVGVTTITSAATSAQVAISTSDINHSIEAPGVAPGSFVVAVSGSTVTLSRKTVAGGGTGKVALIANSSARAVLDGVTTAGSVTVKSATANFVAADIGRYLGGGSLPDGGTIATVVSTSQVTIACTGCLGSWQTAIAAGTALPLTIAPKNPSTSMRFVTDAAFPSATTLTSASAHFAATDVRQPVSGAGVAAGTRITATATGGASATVACPVAPCLNGAGARQVTIGGAEKNAPSNNDVIGQESIQLTLNPLILPTAPPCSANKISAYEIQLQWHNPGNYDTHVSASNTDHDFGGNQMPGTSNAQFQFKTAPTTFSGYLLQNTTMSGTTATTTGWQVSFPFVPTTLAVCPGQGVASGWHFNPVSVTQAQVPTGTGPPGAPQAVRALLPLPQNTSQNYTGTTGATRGAFVATGAGVGNQPTNTNSCTLASPNSLGYQCGK
jgi:hypothetical protein